MKILITGVAGFVSKHFLNLLSSKNEDSLVIGIDRNDTSLETGFLKHIKINCIKSDLKDKESLKKIIDDFHPEFILHLASSSSVFYSWQHPSEVFINNNSIFLAILDAARESGRNIRILSTGTSDVYGISANTNPHIKENASLHPANPYAASKASQELIAKVYADSFGLDIIQTRSFTHFGPYQKENFVLAKFAKQLTLIKKGLQPPLLTTGNLDIIRDISDVRDVVTAYEQLLKKGKCGEIYNVCSGKGIRLRDVLLLMQKKLNVDVEIRQDESLFRKGDIQSIIGDNKKIFNDTGWQPNITIEKSIEDLLDYWDEQTQ